MPNCYLTNQHVTLGNSKIKIKNFPQYAHLFMFVNIKGLTSSLKATRTLKLRHVVNNGDLLPFSINTKLFHAPPSKTPQNYSMN